MTRSARGTRAVPGRNVRAKAGLNRGILAAGWTLLVTRLEHKAPGRVEPLQAAYTSQTCNACQHIRDREPTAVGRTVAARGDRAKSARSMKREPRPVDAAG